MATFVPSADSDGPKLLPLPLTPVSEVEARVRLAVGKSFTYASQNVSVSAGSRLVAWELKATLVPSADSGRLEVWPLPLTPVSEVETSVMLPVLRFFTYAS